MQKTRSGYKKVWLHNLLKKIKYRKHVFLHMNELEREMIDKIKKDFQKIKKKNTLTPKDEALLLGDITNLLGFFRVDPDRTVGRFIEEMISHGEDKGEVMAGARISFEQMKRMH